MAKKTYVGVNNIAQEVSKMYVGVGDVARKVTKAYVGVNGVAEQVYDSGGGLKIVTWNGGTDAEIVAMVEAADRGEINLSDYWSVGDERTVSLSAMPATGVGESHAAQSITFVLMDTNKIDLDSPTVGGRTKSQFVIGMKDILTEPGYMHSSATSYIYWGSNEGYICDRRPWCNNVFYAAIPQSLRSIFKLFKTPYHGTVDRFSLFAEKEIQGTYTHSSAYEAQEETQIEYYKTASHRCKAAGNVYVYWSRSKSSAEKKAFCATQCNSGTARTNMMNYTQGISPFGVM